MRVVILVFKYVQIFLICLVGHFGIFPIPNTKYLVKLLTTDTSVICVIIIMC